MVMSEYRFRQFGRDYRLYTKHNSIVLSELKTAPNNEIVETDLCEFGIGTPIFQVVAEFGSFVFRRIDVNTPELEFSSQMTTGVDMIQLVKMIVELLGLSS